MKKFFIVLTLLLSALVAASCGSGGGGGDLPIDVPDDGGVDTGGGDTGGGLTSGVLILSASKSVIKPDNVDSSIITVYALDEKNIILPDVNVSFSTNTGALNAGSATTDTSGKASVTFTSGAMPNDSTATIRASIGTNLWKEISVQAADAKIPATLNISASVPSVPTDNATESVITVTVLSASGGLLPNQEVSFQATGGVLTATTVKTGNDGKATTVFRSGANKINSTARVDATAGPAQANISIQVVGSTLTISPDGPGSLARGQKEPLTIIAKDAAGIAIKDQTISFSDAGVGDVTLSATTATTDSNGQVTVEVTGVAEGTANLTIQGVGATATKVYTIAGTSDTEFFHITSPASEVASGSLGSPGYTVTVSAPAPITVVQFATTLGTWAGTVPASNILDVPVNAGVATAQLISTMAGVATISATDKASPSITDSATISFSAAANTATKIVLQAAPTVVATTLTPDSAQQAMLTAIVYNADNQVVSGAPVSFRIEKPTGGGEFIIPPVAYTNAQGQAKATFTSGTLPSPEGVTVIAMLVDKPAVISSQVITIGGEPGSITLGRATQISALSSTTYKLPMSALVSDGKGGPARNIPVSLTVWPEEYFACDGEHYPNEDKNENLKLDVTAVGSEDTNDDGELTPPASTAGNLIPSPPITTDGNGIANFDLIYLKANYDTIVRVRATAEVSGTETTSTMYFKLPVLESDLKYLPWPTLEPPTGDCIVPVPEPTP